MMGLAELAKGARAGGATGEGETGTDRSGCCESSFSVDAVG
jgi:hypothetical protein